jgi:4-diphosphocytidyl-2-C-methyl-D-erythritol kinase
MKKQIEEVGGGLLVRAPAKLNLSLLIAGERSDGFHEIETLMAKVELYDELFFEGGDKEGIELICHGKYDVPGGRENLVYKACSMLYEAAGVSSSLKVTLKKRIPMGSGLGGGSSDAAAALIGLNRFGGFGLGREELCELAGRLGSDVVFFLNGPLAICTGRGEKIKKIEEKFPFRALLFLAGINISTKRVYEHYVHNQAEYDRLSAKINGLIAEKRIDLVSEICANMLEYSCFELYKELSDLKCRIEALVEGSLCLSGSGSAMYHILPGGDDEQGRYELTLRENIGCESVIVNSNRW